jgi:MOSC domain-containing protein YiiM
VARRNVITQGIDLNSLIGKRFTMQDVEFEGICECKPCSWMDYAIAPGAEAALQGRGGLRAKILTDGRLRAGK